VKDERLIEVPILFFTSDEQAGGIGLAEDQRVKEIPTIASGLLFFTSTCILSQ